MIKEAIEAVKSALSTQTPNLPSEAKFLNKIDTDRRKSESSRTAIETVWDDEDKIYIGDQWSTSFAMRKKDAKKVRPNSVDNFVFPAVYNIHSSLCSTTPESNISISTSAEGDEQYEQETSQKLTDVVNTIKDKNKFTALYKKMVLQAVKHGPMIGMVVWDNGWQGGAGPNRWIGEVRIIAQKKSEFFPDPAILDLEERLQDCSFINRKLRRKLDYFKSRWPEKGKFVQIDEDTVDEEGEQPNQATLIEYWHRGKPQFISDEWKKHFMQMAQEAYTEQTDEMGNVTSEGDPFKAERYKKMAKGELEGVHVAYCTKDVFLDYIPYIHDDGLYPWSYKVIHIDDKSPWGFGEIRNVMIPQVMHNKADEIEIEAMSVEGLGGAYYQKGAVSPKQLDDIRRSSGKGGMYFEVNSLNQIKQREGARVPSNISTYKEHKQRMVETITQNTPIQQGIAQGANMPYKAIAELGARSDGRTKGKAEVIEDFLKELDKLIISRVAQNYTEEREFKAKAKDGKTSTGTFSNKEITKQWEREPNRWEQYIPEFNVNVKVIDERPTDRNYYIQMAVNLLAQKAIDLDSFWYTVEEGKFPPKEEIMSRMQQQAVPPIAATTLPTEQVPPQEQPQQVQPTETQQSEIDPNIQNILDKLTPEQQADFKSRSPEEQQMLIQSMMGGNGNG